MTKTVLIIGGVAVAAVAWYLLSDKGSTPAGAYYTTGGAPAAASTVGGGLAGLLTGHAGAWRGGSSSAPATGAPPAARETVAASATLFSVGNTVAGNSYGPNAGRTGY